MRPVQQKLIKYLYRKNEWLEASTLAEVFSVSTRTISSYVKEINQLYPCTVILSSYRGYHYNHEADNLFDELFFKEEANEHSRTSSIIIKLITHSSINIFDLADELFISDSLMNIELKRVSSTLNPFKLTLQRKKNLLTILGSEENKRKLIASLLRTESDARFSTLHQNDDLFQSRFLSNSRISTTLLNRLNQLLRTDSNLCFNDFGIQNILIHILVMTDRILAAYTLPKEIALTTIQTSGNLNIALHIKDILEDELPIQIPDTELNYLALVISGNALLLNPDEIHEANISNYVPEYYLELGRSLVAALENNYFLPHFSNDFTLRFTIHIMNLVTRARQGVILKNVFADKVKENYPMIYDMALYIVKLLSDKCEIHIGEDEISFLVYHIGSYLSIQTNKNKLNICMIYLNYNNFYMNTFSALKQKYDSVVNFTAASLSSFHELDYSNTDLFITLGAFSVNTKKPQLAFGIFPNAKDYAAFEQILKTLTINKRKEQLKNILSHFIKRELFDFDIYAENEFKLIETLTNRCTMLKLCDNKFQKAVLERELLSSTAIINGIAIPHSLEHICEKSFFYIVINHESISWGNQLVRIIILIGTSKDDTNYFSEIFDDLIKVLYDSASLSLLLKVKNYNDFINTLVNLILKNVDS